MTIEHRIGVTWFAREPPLEAVGAVAFDRAARRLARRLLEEAPGRWSGVAGRGVLAIFGQELPWVDGVIYLGSEGGLFMPTTLKPSVPARLVSRALEQGHGGSQWVVVPSKMAFSSREARPIEAATLGRWLKEAS